MPQHKHEPKPQVLHVLLVEDHPIIQAHLEGVLLNAGHKVDVAHHAEHAIELFDGSKHTFVLTDLNLRPAGKTGFDIIVYVRSKKPGIRVWLMSGQIQELTIQKAIELGAENAVDKLDVPDKLKAHRIIHDT